MESIINLFKKSWVQWGLTLAAIGGTIAYFLKVNDFTRPPIPDPKKPQSFDKDLSKLDPTKPIGVFLFNVYHGNFTDYGVNASRNNYKEKMQEYYGDNMMVVDNPTPEHLKQFAKEFNAKFSDKKPQVHFVANHHQGTYNDWVLADFFASVKGTNKRALVLSCGPVSEAYKQSGCDYVMIPAPDGLGLGVEPSLEISPAYKEAIGWLAQSKDVVVADKKLKERTAYNLFQEIQHKSGAIYSKIIGSPASHEYKPPVVVIPEPEEPPPIPPAPLGYNDNNTIVVPKVPNKPKELKRAPAPIG